MSLIVAHLSTSLLGLQICTRAGVPLERPYWFGVPLLQRQIDDVSELYSDTVAKRHAWGFIPLKPLSKRRPQRGGNALQPIQAYRLCGIQRSDAYRTAWPQNGSTQTVSFREPFRLMRSHHLAARQPVAAPQIRFAIAADVLPAAASSATINSYRHLPRLGYLLEGEHGT